MRFFNVSLNEVFGANRRHEFASISSYVRYGLARRLRVAPQESVRLAYRKPILSTYLYSAYPLGMLPDDTPCVLNTHLQLYYRSNQEELHQANDHLLEYFPMVNLEEYRESGDLEVREVVCEDRPPMAAREVPALISSLLAQGCFIYTYVDLFYIPQSHSYLRGHYRHEILLSGVDARKGTYQAVHYTGRGQFKSVEIPIGLLAHAFVSERAVKCSYEYCRKYRIASIRVPESGGMALDLGAIRAQMVASLSGVAVTQSQIGNATLAGWLRKCPQFYSRGVYGRAIYPCMLRNWEENFGAPSLDIRPSRLLLEHVRLMQVRLNFLGAAGLERIKAFFQEWGEVVLLAQRIQMALVSSKRKANRKNWSEVKRNACALIDAEERILAKVVEIIPTR